MNQGQTDLQNPNYHPRELGGVKHLSLFERGAPERRWDALPYVSDISPPAFMKTGNQHINKTANNHKPNDIYIQPNQTEEACVCTGNGGNQVSEQVSRAETPTCVSTSD